ncbi:hypothetical protein COOONC_28349 [Cooperia oncophora]
MRTDSPLGRSAKTSVFVNLNHTRMLARLELPPFVMRLRKLVHVLISLPSGTTTRPMAPAIDSIMVVVREQEIGSITSKVARQLVQTIKMPALSPKCKDHAQESTNTITSTLGHNPVRSSLTVAVWATQIASRRWRNANRVVSVSN